MVLWMIAGASTAFAQSTSFTYQGRLTDGGTAANGNYDLQFALFDSLSGGTQVGSTQTINTVAVSNGVFTVSLDFGASAFNGASRFLEISARPSGGGSFTLLSPRQQITSTPYAVRSLNASSADSVPASGVPSGSGNYIQNTNSTQTGNFNVSGNGAVGGTLTGNIINAGTQFNIGGNRVLSTTGNFNVFAGQRAGQSNSGAQNSFFGDSAGSRNTGNLNSFFGQEAGGANTTGPQNSFFGQGSGSSNTSGGFNSFFGRGAGVANTTGSVNTFVGESAGGSNTTGSLNSFFGIDAGFAVTSGNRNTFIGDSAGGFANTSNGDNNTLLGAGTFVTTGVNNGTAIGARAQVSQSNSLVLGGILGVNGGTDTNVGIGTTAPTARLSVVATGDGARVLHLGTERAWVFKQFGSGAGTALELTTDDPINNNKNFVINTTGNVGVGTTGPLDRLHVFGDIRVGVTGTNGCLKNNNGGVIVGTCSSDARFKRDIRPFPNLLNRVTQLQPVHFYWRAAEFPQKGFGNAENYGLVAQDVERAMPELVSDDAEGFKQVDYSKLPLLLLQAIKELKAENDQLKHRLHKVERTLRTRSSVARRR